MSRQQRGAASEAAAVHFLEQQGLTFVAKNFTLDNAEIDIIMRAGERLIFVEVKYRHDESFAAVLSQISPGQCQRIRHAARVFMLQNDWDEHATAVRFDVVAIVGHPTTIHWLQDAF